MGLIQSYGSSGEKSENTAIKTSSGFLGGVLVLTDGTNDATVKLYDNASAASGVVLWEAVVPATDRAFPNMFPFPITFNNGLYLSISGTGAKAIVYYR